jgi:hypothetical protein
MVNRDTTDEDGGLQTQYLSRQRLYFVFHFGHVFRAIRRSLAVAQRYLVNDRLASAFPTRFADGASSTGAADSYV